MPATVRQLICDRRRPIATVLLAAVWLGVVAWGWAAMTASGFLRDGRPGDGGLVGRWPVDSKLDRPAGEPVLALFLHPRCPCSRAALAELEGVLRDPRLAAPRVLVVATIPGDAGPDWTEGEYASRSKQLPHGQLVFDRGGFEAARFGATASGTAMLFDGAGVLRYGGGVTEARGEEGANAGTDSLRNLLSGKPSTAPAIPVFGCRLVLPGE